MLPLPARAEDYRDDLEKLHDAVIGQARTLAAGGNNAREIFAALEPRYATLPVAPSELVLTNEVAPILEIYAPALHALETRLVDTLRTFVSAQVRLFVADYTIEQGKQMRSARMKTLWARMLSPAPHDVERWGAAAARDKTGAYEIPFDPANTRQLLDAAMLADLVAQTGVAEKGGTTKTWLTARMQDREEAEANWQTAINEFNYSMRVLVEKSLLEATLAIDYDQLLSNVIADLHAQWRAKLAVATSVADLQRIMEPAFGNTLRRIDDIAAAYMTSVPRLSAADRVPAAPTSRDSSQLFRTQHGAAIVALVAALRPLVPKQLSALQFVKTLPPNLGAATVQTAGAWVPLTPVQAWMQQYGSVDTSAAFAALRR